MKVFTSKTAVGMDRVTLSEVAATSVVFGTGEDARHAVDITLKSGAKTDLSLTTAELEAFDKAYDAAQ